MITKILYVVLVLMVGGLPSISFAQQMCRLTVEATPPDSRIRIMSIKPKYHDGILLLCGSHEILVEKQGYLAFHEWVDVIYPGGSIEVTLQRLTHSNFNAIKTGDFEHKEKTLGILDAIFQNRQGGYLNKISTSRFQRSGWYQQTLQGYIGGTYRLNLNHSSEMATQEFIINGNENHVLVVDFEHSKKTNLWYIADAYQKKGSRIIPFRKSGFKPNEFERKFSDLVRKIQSGKILPYYGLAPHGKLNRRSLQGKTLSLSTERSITIKDIIIHDGSQVRDVIFLKLKYYLPGNRENGTYQSGWLLAGGGSMSNFYKPGENLFADIVFKRNLNLNQKNEGLIYFNLKELSSNQPRTSMSAGNQPRTSMPNSTYNSTYKTPPDSSTVHSNSQSDDVQEDDDDSWMHGGKKW